MSTKSLLIRLSAVVLTLLSLYGMFRVYKLYTQHIQSVQYVYCDATENTSATETVNKSKPIILPVQTPESKIRQMCRLSSYVKVGVHRQTTRDVINTVLELVNRNPKYSEIALQYMADNFTEQQIVSTAETLYTLAQSKPLTSDLPNDYIKTYRSNYNAEIVSDKNITKDAIYRDELDKILSLYRNDKKFIRLAMLVSGFEIGSDYKWKSVEYGEKIQKNITDIYTLYNIDPATGESRSKIEQLSQSMLIKSKFDALDNIKDTTKNTYKAETMPLSHQIAYAVLYVGLYVALCAVLFTLLFRTKRKIVQSSHGVDVIAE